MARRQHQAIPVRPLGIARIEFQEAREQDRGDISHAHRHAGMTRFGGFNSVNGKGAYGIRHVAGREI